MCIWLLLVIVTVLDRSNIVCGGINSNIRYKYHGNYIGVSTKDAGLTFDWSSANSFCNKTFGTSLASFHNDSELWSAFLLFRHINISISTRGVFAWIGLNSINSNSSDENAYQDNSNWAWSDGSSTNWNEHLSTDQSCTNISLSNYIDDNISTSTDHCWKWPWKYTLNGLNGGDSIFGDVDDANCVAISTYLSREQPWLLWGDESCLNNQIYRFICNNNNKYNDSTINTDEEILGHYSRTVYTNYTINDKWIGVYVSSGLSWYESLSFCNDTFNTTLGSIHNSDENNQVYNLLVSMDTIVDPFKIDFAWVGIKANDTYPYNFIWIDGTPPDYWGGGGAIPGGSPQPHC